MDNNEQGRTAGLTTSTPVDQVAEVVGALYINGGMGIESRKTGQVVATVLDWLCDTERLEPAIELGDRLAACWNACNGLETSAIEALGAGGVKELLELLSACSGAAATVGNCADPDERVKHLLAPMDEISKRLYARLEGGGK